MRVDVKGGISKSARRTQRIDNGIEAQKRVFDIPPSQWSRRLLEATPRRLLTPKEISVLKIAEKIPSRVPTERQSAILIDILGMAEQEGIL